MKQPRIVRVYWRDAAPARMACWCAKLECGHDVALYYSESQEVTARLRQRAGCWYCSAEKPAEVQP